LKDGSNMFSCNSSLICRGLFALAVAAPLLVQAQTTTILQTTQEIIPTQDGAQYRIDFTETQNNTVSGVGSITLARSFLVTGGYITGTNLSPANNGDDQNYAIFHSTTSTAENVKSDNVLFTIGQGPINTVGYGNNLRFPFNDRESVVTFPQPILIRAGHSVSLRYSFANNDVNFRDYRIILFGQQITETGVNNGDGRFFVEAEPKVINLSGPVATIPPVVVVRHLAPRYALTTTATVGVSSSFANSTPLQPTATILSGPRETNEGFETLIQVAMNTDGLSAGRYENELTLTVTANGSSSSSFQIAEIPIRVTLNAASSGMPQAWVIH
jgi:hypothetical protein